MTAASTAGLVAFARRLADSARPIVREYFRTAVAVESKSDTSPVTAADRKIETVIRRLIEAEFPDHGIVGEEFGNVRTEAEFVWVIDPIDGTKAFITGKPLFGTLIALLRDGAPFLGIIDMPVLDERWVGAPGHPTSLNDRPARVRACASIGNALLATTTPDMFVGHDADAFARLSAAVSSRHFGGDCYNYALLSSGFLDLVVEAGLKTYDYMALVPVITEAGGIITDWAGRPLGPASDGRVVAAGDARVHAAAVERLAA